MQSKHIISDDLMEAIFDEGALIPPKLIIIEQLDALPPDTDKLTWVENQNFAYLELVSLFLHAAEKGLLEYVKLFSNLLDSPLVHQHAVDTAKRSGHMNVVNYLSGSIEELRYNASSNVKFLFFKKSSGSEYIDNLPQDIKNTIADKIMNMDLI